MPLIRYGVTRLWLCSTSVELPARQVFQVAKKLIKTMKLGRWMRSGEMLNVKKYHPCFKHKPDETQTAPPPPTPWGKDPKTFRFPHIDALHLVPPGPWVADREKEIPWTVDFKCFFVSFFTATTNPAAAGQCSQGLKVETFCGQICNALHHLLWDPDSVLPSISLWKAAFRIASGQDDNSHVTSFQPMQLSFLVLLQFRWCSWHILRPGCRPAAGWSDFEPLWSSWLDRKDITEGPRHTAFGGCNCRIHLSALSWPCTWDALETLFASEWWTSDTLPIHFLILSDVGSYFSVPGSGSSCGWNCFRQTAWGMQRLRTQPGSRTPQFHPWRRC